MNRRLIIIASSVLALGACMAGRSPPEPIPARTSLCERRPAPAPGGTFVGQGALAAYSIVSRGAAPAQVDRFRATAAAAGFRPTVRININGFDVHVVIGRGPLGSAKAAADELQALCALDLTPTLYPEHVRYNPPGREGDAIRIR